MKVVILCGGKGTRLHEETEFRPKPLVPIGKAPILWHIMKIYSSYGFKEFILCLGYKGNMIKEYFLNYEVLDNDFTLNLSPNKPKIVIHGKSDIEDWSITFVDTGIDTQTGGRIARIRNFVENDEHFFLTYGDGVSNVNINELYEFHKKQGKILTLTGVNPPSPFGVITYKDGVVTSFKEKPRLEGVINGGFLVCNKRVFDYLSIDNKCVFEEKPIKTLTKESQVALYKHKGFWYSMDTQKHVNELNKIWESGNAPWKIW